MNNFLCSYHYYCKAMLPLHFPSKKNSKIAISSLQEGWPITVSNFQTDSVIGLYRFSYYLSQENWFTNFNSSHAFTKNTFFAFDSIYIVNSSKSVAGLFSYGRVSATEIGLYILIGFFKFNIGEQENCESLDILPVQRLSCFSGIGL